MLKPRIRCSNHPLGIWDTNAKRVYVALLRINEDQCQFWSTSAAQVAAQVQDYLESSAYRRATYCESHGA